MALLLLYLSNEWLCIYCIILVYKNTAGKGGGAVDKQKVNRLGKARTGEKESLEQKDTRGPV